MKKYVDKLRKWCNTDTISKSAERISDNKGFIGIVLPLGSVVVVILLVALILFGCLDGCSCGLLSCLTTCACNGCESCINCASPLLSCCDSCYCGTAR